MARIAVYPGSFDPVTYGHMDVIERAASLFDELIVAVSLNPGKNPLFTIEERAELLREVLHPWPNVKVDFFKGLTVNYAEKVSAQAIIRGLRAVSDFENEFVMALTNRKMSKKVDTIFLMTKAEYSFLSSSVVKEAASFGGCIKDFVPEVVRKRLIDRLREINNIKGDEQ